MGLQAGEENGVIVGVEGCSEVKQGEDIEKARVVRRGECCL